MMSKVIVLPSRYSLVFMFLVQFSLVKLFVIERAWSLDVCFDFALGLLSSSSSRANVRAIVARDRWIVADVLVLEISASSQTHG